MKYSALVLSLFAAAGLAAPVAEAEAAPAAVAEANADPEACFLTALLGLGTHLFGLNGCCDSCRGEYAGVTLGATANIFLTPGGNLIYGNTIDGSVPFKGTIINGNLYANTPFIGNGLGAVNYNDDGRLIVGANVGASLGWYRRNRDVFASVNDIYAFPDDNGHHYLYYGKHHHNNGRKPITFRWY